MNEAQLLSIQVGLPETRGNIDVTGSMDELWTTGLFKETVDSPVRLGTTNLAGDGQADLKHHGGPDKAINVYSFEHYPYWQSTLNLPELPHGAFGENFTTLGLLEADVCIGDVFHIGETIVQLSQPRQPCWKLERRWRVKDFAERIRQTGRTGWYFRVLREGTIESGACIHLLERPYPEWSVARANDVMYNHQTDLKVIRELIACPVLSVSWQESLSKRAAVDSQ